MFITKKFTSDADDPQSYLISTNVTTTTIIIIIIMTIMYNHYNSLTPHGADLGAGARNKAPRLP